MLAIRAGIMMSHIPPEITAGNDTAIDAGIYTALMREIKIFFIVATFGRVFLVTYILVISLTLTSV
jgi:hypothetical protein